MENNIIPLLDEAILAINLGPKQFYESLEKQGVEAVQVDWTPSAGGDKDMIKLLDELL
ncbi:MAG: fdrA domain protein [Chloroflexota bacterium]